MERFLTGFADELTKTAARAGLKLIRRLVHGGEMVKAERLALTPGVLKKTRAGSEIKDLGRGMEGTSTLIAHPKKGIVVRKIYDPQGISKPEGILRKEQFAKDVPSPSVAQHYGASTSKGGLRMHYSEYVPGQSTAKIREGAIAAMGNKAVPPAQRVKDYAKKIEGTRQIELQSKRLQQQSARHGYKLGDLHGENVMGTPTPSGRMQMKAVDFFSQRGGDTADKLLHNDRLPIVRGGVDPYYQNRAAGADLKRQAFRGTAPKHVLGPPKKRRFELPPAGTGELPPPITMPGGSPASNAPTAIPSGD